MGNDVFCYTDEEQDRDNDHTHTGATHTCTDTDTDTDHINQHSNDDYNNVHCNELKDDNVEDDVDFADID